MSKEKQLRVISQRKPQIIIGTPGRLHELLDEQAINFDTLKYLVIDEADRMIEMGHFKEIDEILEKIFVPKKQEFFDKDFDKINRDLDYKAAQELN
jgi:ATP-dependent RNA helicase DDX24/MAK5